MELFEESDQLSSLRDETIDSNQVNKKLSSKQLNFMRNAWKNMDQKKQKKFKRLANQKLKSNQEIKDFDYFVDYLDGGQDQIPYKNQQGECIIPWAILDVFVWTLAGLTGGICTIC